MIEEISKVAVAIAKGKGATLLIDKSGPTMVGVSNVLYYDPSLEITDEVMDELNKGRPPAVAAPSSSNTNAPQNPSDSPKITVPGIAPSK
jgi:outer membrane protein